MNFDEVIEKIKDGTATAEEKLFFDRESREILSIKNILDNPPAEPVVEQANSVTVGKAIKTFQRKSVYRAVAAALIFLSLVALLVCAIIFIPSVSSARANQIIDRDEAVTMAEDFLREKGIAVDEYEIHDIDSELRIFGSLRNAYFAYEIEFRSASHIYGVSVGTSSGHVYLVFSKDLNN